MHPTSAASAACAKVNSVVANVRMPDCSSVRQASRPSQVLGILRQTREVSNSGCRYRKSRVIPGGDISS